MSQNAITISELSILCKCANISIDKVIEDNKTMKEIKEDLEKTILETYHKYNIYYSESEKAWRTYLPDDTKPRKRKPVKRKSKEMLQSYLVKQYLATKI